MEVITPKALKGFVGDTVAVIAAKIEKDEAVAMVVALVVITDKAGLVLVDTNNNSSY